MGVGVFHELSAMGKNTGLRIWDPGLRSTSTICFLCFFGQFTQDPIFLGIGEKDAFKCLSVGQPGLATGKS